MTSLVFIYCYVLLYLGWCAEGKHHDFFRLNNPSLSAVAEHAIDTGHKIGWDDAHIIDFETYFWPRKVKEAIWIKKNIKSLL